MLLGLAIPLILTATIFAVPSGTGTMASLESFIPTISRTAQATEHNTHTIHMTAEELPNGQLAYKMLGHTVSGESGTVNLTSKYSEDASIPGPTIVINEGDEVSLTIHNSITSRPDQLVSVHVHGVHYEITSDGTLAHINMVGDQGAYPSGSFTYHWIAGPGTAGTWPYHDHTFGGINGAENKGLFGTLIVNPASSTVKAVQGNAIQDVSISQIKKDFVLYLGDDAFWGMEIDENGNQTPLWVNPTLKAKNDDYVRFHLIALGTDMHKFQMSQYQWVDPGTTSKINMVDIGPLENHQFTVKTKNGTAQYIDQNESNKLMGMRGTFVGSAAGGTSIPGPSPI
jgi:FtsP/CotA-like multicopper oxidase with cupredoxin domain